MDLITTTIIIIIIITITIIPIASGSTAPTSQSYATEIYTPPPKEIEGFQGHVPMRVRRHFPTECHFSVVFSKGLGLRGKNLYTTTNTCLQRLINITYTVL